MLTNNAAYKYETPYNKPHVINLCWTNGTVTLQYGTIKIRHNICRIKLYTSDTNVEDVNPKNMCDDINIQSTFIYVCIVLKLGHKLYNHIRTDTLTLIHIGHAREVFHDEVIFFTWSAPQVNR